MVSIDKADQLRALERSVVAESRNRPHDVSPGVFSIWLGAAYENGIPPWGTNVWMRDRELRRFMIQEHFFASALGIVAARNAALSWDLTGKRPRLVDYAHRMLNDVNFGGGWDEFIVQTTIDLATQDQGAFIEIVREADRPDAPVLGLNHLDAGLCYPTGNPERPVIYQEPLSGEWIEMKWYQVYRMLEMPSPITPMDLGYFGKLQYCLDADATVRMADGTTKRIRDVVRDRDEGPVLTLAPDGSMQARRITEWYTNSVGERSWINVRGRAVSMGSGNKRRNSWVTDDHPFLTPDGWMRAGDIRTGTPIVTERPAPNRQQMELLIGTLLGDATVRGKRTPSITIAHKVENADWLACKTRGMSGFRYVESERSVGGRDMAFVAFASEPAFIELRDSCYADGKRVFPRGLVEEFISDRMIATWYLDDGHLSIRGGNTRPRADIGCSSYSWDDIRWVADRMNERGYTCTVRGQGGSSNGPRIFFTVDGTDALMRAIGKYVPDSMRYKVTDAAPAFDSRAWDLGAPGRFIDEAVVEAGPHGRTTAYCIDVEETHNFVTAGMVVHNCTLTRVLRAAHTMQSIWIYNDEKASGRFNRALHFVSGIGEKQVQDALARATLANDDEGLRRYSPGVLVTAVNQNAEINVKTIEQASLPAGWDEEKAIKHYILALSMAFMTDYQEFAPLPGGGLGTGAQSEILDKKSRGKGPALFQSMMTRLMNHAGILPRGVEFAFNEPDPDAAKDDADLQHRKAETAEINIRSGVWTPQFARQVQLDDGSITEEQFQVLSADTGQSDQTATIVVQDDELSGSVTPQMVKALGALTIPAVKAAGPSVSFGPLLNGRLHRAYATTSDDIGSLGYFATLDDRLAVASAVGPALAIMETALREAGLWDLQIAAEDADAIVERAWKQLSMSPDPATLPPVSDEEERLSIEQEVADTALIGLREMRAAIRKRLETLD